MAVCIDVPLTCTVGIFALVVRHLPQSSQSEAAEDEAALQHALMLFFLSATSHSYICLTEYPLFP